MALPDLTGKNIQETYQRVIHTDGNKIYNGTGSLLPIEFNENNVIISGTLTAQTYVVSESITNVSSGSTIFGNSIDDVHQRTGSLNISGNIHTNQIHLPVGGDIIWEGDTNTRIETSGDPHDIDIYADRHIRLFADSNIDFGNGPQIRYSQSTNVFDMNVQTQYGSEGVSVLTWHVTASGNISASNIIGTINGGSF
tara:strand:+ start:43 stop:630 length:588 start_codon:yes stop_codon:yes gene_type:complete